MKIIIVQTAELHKYYFQHILQKQNINSTANIFLSIVKFILEIISRRRFRGK
jgi:hypothetical protein